MRLRAMRSSSRPAKALGEAAPAVPSGWDYIITNDAGWATIPAGLLSGGGRIGIAPGSYTSKTITASPSARLTFGATDAGSKPVIERLVIGTCANVTLEDLDLRCSTWANADATAAAMLITGTATALISRRCEFRGNYRGSFGDIDVVSALPEYACIAADVSGGAISALEITQSYVGDLLADGTYSADFTPAGGTGAVATFNVVAGFIASTSLTAGGTGYTTSQHRTRRAIWAGQRRMLDWLPWGVRAQSPGTLVNPVFENCVFRNTANALKPSRVTGSFTATGCDFERTYMDHISIGLNHPDAAFPCIIAFNAGRLPFSVAAKDAGDPHSDWIQLFADDLGGAGNMTSADWDNILIVGNVFQDGSARGGVQGMIIADIPSLISYAGAKIVGNHTASKNLTLGLALVNPRDAYIYGNTFIRHDYSDAANNTSAVVLRVPGVQDDPSGGYYAYGHSFIGANIAESIETNGWALPEIDTTRAANTVLGTRGATIAYTAAFAAPAGARATLAEIASAYAAVGAHAGRGAFGIPNVVAHTSKVYSPQNEPSFVGFLDLTGQTASTSVSSGWSRILGGGAGRAISISGGEYRLASDAAGTGASAWTSGAGVVNPGQFVQMRQTTSASGGSTTTATLTIGSQSFGWATTTASVASFSSVDNQATGRSRATSISTETGLKKIVIAFRAKPDAVTAAANLLADSAASAFRVWFPSTAAYRAQFFSSTRCNLRPVLTPGTTPKTHIITLDLSNTVASQGCYWATIEDGVLLNNSPGAGGIFDTRSTAGSGADYGAFAPAANGSTGLFGSVNELGVFGEADGGGVLFDGAFEFLYIDWGGAGYTIPDITQSGVRSKWTADQILANGAGPTGAQPKLYYTGTAAEWNAGLANKGSLAASMTKQAGTYV